MRAPRFALIALIAVGVGIATGFGVQVVVGPGRGVANASPGASSQPSSGPASTGIPTAGGSARPTGSQEPGASTGPTPDGSPSLAPSPTPDLVPAPLTGLLVSPSRAARHPIAIMVDDQARARPQSGFSQASIVWQAPAEGGIPRYMMIFAEGDPKAVGPVRSARIYFVGWAAEWKALYGHVGGSPQAMKTLRTKGGGQYVYNADQFRWAGSGFYWRIKERSAPHNVYTTGAKLRALAKRVKATAAPAPIWQFAADAALAVRPTGGRILVNYPQNKVRYDYDRKTNTYLRWANFRPHYDAVYTKATKIRVAPKNVIIMLMRFGPLNDGSKKHRLEAQQVGSGRAYIATNGRTITGTWRKKSFTAPTQFFDKKGQPVTLTAGQTFIQVVPVGTKLTFVKGKAPPAVPSSPAPSGTSSPGPTASP